jgi:site-specific DNA-methyltransferase (adenine-specific)
MNLDILYTEECISGMAKLEDESVDMVLSDLPYGTTQCSWDTPIPLPPLWEQFERITRPNSAIVLTAAQPFTSALIMSNPGLFRYSWVWEKSKATGYLNSKKRPMVAHEDILVFSKERPEYYPQMREGDPYNKGEAKRPTAVYGEQRSTLVKSSGQRYPRSVIYFKTAESEGKVVHPTQKPLALFEYLIQTYTRPGGVVLDCCMGSGTTAVAAIKTGRHFVGFEIDPQYASIATERIKKQNESLRPDKSHD